MQFLNAPTRNLFFTDKGGVGKTSMLGILLALSFCPVSAALFFGRFTGVEKWRRRITGISVLLVGVYITLQQIYHV